MPVIWIVFTDLLFFHAADSDEEIDFEDSYQELEETDSNLEPLEEPVQAVASGSGLRRAPDLSALFPAAHNNEDQPSNSSGQSIREAIVRSEELLEMADMPPKACHCACSLGPDGQGCLTQFTATEIDEIR